MKKYLFALLCCALLALGFIPAQKASAATELRGMRVDNWAFPKDGQPITSSCTITFDGLSADSVTTYCEMLWYDDSGHICEGTFKGGCIYNLNVLFRLKSSYTLADGFRAIFNGGSMSSATWLGSGADCWKVEAGYMCSIQIKEVKITSVTEPEDGATPVNTFSVNGSNVSARTSDSYWYNVTDGKRMNGEAFEADKKYRFYASVERTFGNSWPESYSSISAFMNGNSAGITKQEGTEYYYVYSDFTCISTKITVTDIKITGVTEPVDGAVPNTSFSIASAGVISASPAAWFNFTDGYWLGSNSFEGGKTYQLNIYVTVAEGYKWPSSFSGLSKTINGQSATLFSVSGQNYYSVSVKFTCPEKPVEYYSISILNGSADKVTAAAGTKVTITADSDAGTNKFNQWVVLSGGNNSMLADSSSRSTTFTMPASDISIVAHFINEAAVTPTVPDTTGGSGSTPTPTPTVPDTTGGSGSSGATTGSDPSDKSDDNIPKKGDIIVSNTEKAIYEVTSAGNRSGKVGKVTYVEPTKHAKSITVKGTVTIDGIKYTVTAIAARAFKNDKKLEKIVIAKEIKTIGTSCFYNCTTLKTVELKGAYKIKAKAFYHCSKLTKIVISSSKLTSSTVGIDAFAKINKKAVISVPSKKVSSYKKLLKKVGLTGSSQTVKAK